MNKFNEQKQTEETTLYETGELMNEQNNIDNDIREGDKVTWTTFVGDNEIAMKGLVLGESNFGGHKEFIVRTLGVGEVRSMIHHSRVSKL
tara:strand:- start:275 stop:544 length:270 start_codon:yes stop_codon:yes gene_type:complete